MKPYTPPAIKTHLTLTCPVCMRVLRNRDGLLVDVVDFVELIASVSVKDIPLKTLIELLDEYELNTSLAQDRCLLKFADAACIFEIFGWGVESHFNKFVKSYQNQVAAPLDSVFFKKLMDSIPRHVWKLQDDPIQTMEAYDGLDEHGHWGPGLRPNHALAGAMLVQQWFHQFEYGKKKGMPTELTVEVWRNRVAELIVFQAGVLSHDWTVDASYKAALTEWADGHGLKDRVDCAVTS